MAKHVSPAILPPLREALTLAFWFKPDLRRHLNSCLPDHRALVAQLDWSDYKRNIVGQLVDTLHADQHKYLDALLTLILGTADITDPAHLKRLDTENASTLTRWPRSTRYVPRSSHTGA
jgi:hypothetical protein